jgi:hypothetical protein
VNAPSLKHLLSPYATGGDRTCGALPRSR